MSRSEFDEIEVLRDQKTRVIAVISRRDRPDGRSVFTFALMKEFEDKGGPTRRSSFFSKRHLSGVRRMTDAAEDRVEALEDDLYGPN